MTVFADADGDFTDSRYVIFGIPVDDTASFRQGARLAPLHIRLASYNFETHHLKSGLDLAQINIHDAGDYPKIDSAEVMATGTVSAGKVPIVLGGEHSITTAVPIPEGADVIYIDAHGDFREEYLGDTESHSTVARRLSEKGHRIIHIGLRSISIEETVAFTGMVKQLSMNPSALELRNAIFSDKVYISLDMDAIDPSEAPGVSNPEPNGMASSMVMEIISTVADKLIGMDIVEVCPPYDEGDRTSLLAGSIARHAIAEMESKRQD